MASVQTRNSGNWSTEMNIRQLMYKYAHCWDNLDFRGWASCFTEDGVYWGG